MMFLALFFCPPIYFLVRKRWLSFGLSLTLYGIAVLCIISIIGAVIAPFFWIMAVGHAGWHLRFEMIRRHADAVGTAVGKQMQMQNAAPPQDTTASLSP